MTSKSLARTTAFLIGLEILLFLSTVIIGNITGFSPGNDRPLSEILPTIAKNHAGSISVYLAYVSAGIVLIPISILLPRLLATPLTPLLQVGMVMGILSAALRIISVSRYLFFVPYLADTFVNSPTQQQQVQFAYQANDAFAGTGLGEYLGDGLLLGLWLLLLAIAIVQTRRIPAWMGWSGGVVALGLLSECVFAFIPGMGSVIVLSLTLAYFWLIPLGIVVARHRSM